jgi:hypothetical protein
MWEHDIFLLGGAEDLVPIADPGPGATRFRPRTEGAFARIEYEYERDSGADGPRLWDRTYLRRIRYRDYEDGGATRSSTSSTERPGAA